MDNNSTVIQTVFYDIHSPDPGGAISIYSTITFKISGSSFYNVSSEQDGGAIYFYKANMLLKSISFYKCYSLVILNQHGGNTIYSPTENNHLRSFELKDSVLCQCFFKKKTPGDSVMIIFDGTKSILHDLNFTNNANGLDSTPGACSGDMNSTEIESKRISITDSSGYRAVCINSANAVNERMNIINNTCKYIVHRHGKFVNCFIYGNRNSNNEFPKVIENKQPSFQLVGCWGDLDLDEIEKKNSPNELVLRTIPPSRVIQTRVEMGSLKFILSFSLLIERT